MATSAPLYNGGGETLDEVLFPAEGVDTHFVDSLLATLQVPGNWQSQVQLAQSMPPIPDAGSDRHPGNAQSIAATRSLDKEPSGGSSGSEKGQHQPLSPSLRVREKNKRAQVCAPPLMARHTVRRPAMAEQGSGCCLAKSQLCFNRHWLLTAHAN